MINFREMKEFVVLGGGTAGWFAALELQRLFGARVSITVLESPSVKVIGVGEGGILNFPQSLKRYGIDEREFIAATGAVIKLGFSYIGWNNGARDDIFYHLFHEIPQEGLGQSVNGILPHWATLLANGMGVHHACRSFPLVREQASQELVRRECVAAGLAMPSSLHFDAHRVAEYLKRVAMGRGVKWRQAQVLDLELDSSNARVRGLRIQNESAAMPVDFLVDASGFARVALGKTYKTPWRPLNRHSFLDRAIPFHLPPTKPNPALTTRALAMNAGWMWQIPLQERVGCGYVFSSEHLSENAAVEEIEARLGQSIVPMATLKFSAGHFEDVWVGNAMAVGLASGFVEPLEATSIGQMLGQVAAFGDAVVSSDGIVPMSTVRTFNRRNAMDWEGIRDFLRMHYDVKRRDTPFWRDVAAQELPASYVALKDCWQHRMPRPVDLIPYRFGHLLHFDFTSWIAVAQGVGALSTRAAASDLARLPHDVIVNANGFLASLQERHALDASMSLASDTVQG